jgi:hypothetical protein
MSEHLDPSTLAQFTGTEHWFRHGLSRGVAYTDGVKYVADTAGAYWLVDIIAIAQRLDEAVREEPFQLWKLEVRENDSATVICEDGNGKPLYRQDIEWTDFAREGISFYCCEDSTTPGITRLILLPSEY